MSSKTPKEVSRRRGNRRNLIKAAGTTIAAGAGLAPQIATGAGRKRFRWRLVMVVPKTLPLWGEGVQQFAERVAEMTDKLSVALDTVLAH